jgi:hypothetical protein
MGVLDEDVGHPAYRPDSDLVEELLAVIGRHKSRLTLGGIFGSLLVCLRVVIFAPMRSATRTAVPVTPDTMIQLLTMMNQYLSRPGRKGAPTFGREH